MRCIRATGSRRITTGMASGAVKPQYVASFAPHRLSPEVPRMSVIIATAAAAGLLLLIPARRKRIRRRRLREETLRRLREIPA